jgi:hypothetical protein
VLGRAAIRHVRFTPDNDRESGFPHNDCSVIVIHTSPQQVRVDQSIDQCGTIGRDR